MGLRLKFNLVLLLVFLVGLGVAGWISRDLLIRNARDEVSRNASLMMEAALAVRGYTISQVRPHLEMQLMRAFLPQTVPAFAAAETMGELRKKYPDYFYKEATLNPTNPRNRAADWEADIVQEFRNRPTVKELGGERDTPTGRALYIARPIQIGNPACLGCHSTPEAAPATMVKLYGPAQRVRLEAQRDRGRAGRVGADGAAAPERAARVLHLHGLAGRGVRARVHRAQRDAELDDRPAGGPAVARGGPGQHRQLRDPGVPGAGPGRDRRASAGRSTACGGASRRRCR